MPWYAGNEQNPDEWINQTYTHEKIIMQPDLPNFNNYQLIAANGLLESNQSWSLYPNPADTWIHVQPPGNYDLQLFDLYGKTIRTKENALAIPVDDLNPGIYFLQIIDRNSRVVKKFIKE